MKTNHFISACAIFLATFTSAQNALTIPDTLNGTNFNLNIYDTSRVFYSGYTTNTFGINGAFLGPTLFLNQGDSVSMNVNNQLSDTTTIHWHGLHVASKNDGGPHTVILSGATWNPSFKVRDLAGTYWYHPHLHMKTNLHATKGAAGMIIIRDSMEATLNLPRRYGIDDFPLVIQSKAFSSTKQIIVGDAYDSVMMVNGTLNPYLQVPAQVVRLRMLNASSDRVYNYGFTANKPFYQIASDGGLLQDPILLTRLKLAPGERAEILIDLGGMQGQNIDLLSFASELPNGIYGASNPSSGMGTITGYASNVLNGTNFNILQLQIAAPTSAPITSIPATLTNVTPWNLADAAVTKTLTFSPKTMGPSQMVNGPFVINNLSFDMEVINYTINKDDIEIWQLSNQTNIAHPFHIHDIQFYVYEINGIAPPLNMRGRKDVVLVPAQQTVKLIAKFENFCDTIPYMYHCHMLKHEDDGMMGQFIVQCPVTNISDLTYDNNSIVLFPNPASEQLQINIKDFDSSKQLYVTFYDVTGRIVFRTNIEQPKFSLNIAQWESGFYTAEISDGRKMITKKIIKSSSIVD